jgi:hypothetical protein
VSHPRCVFGELGSSSCLCGVVTERTLFMEARHVARCIAQIGCQCLYHTCLRPCWCRSGSHILTSPITCNGSLACVCLLAGSVGTQHLTAQCCCCPTTQASLDALGLHCPPMHPWLTPKQKIQQRLCSVNNTSPVSGLQAWCCGAAVSVYWMSLQTALLHMQLGRLCSQAMCEHPLLLLHTIHRLVTCWHPALTPCLILTTTAWHQRLRYVHGLATIGMCHPFCWSCRGASVCMLIAVAVDLHCMLLPGGWE